MGQGKQKNACRPQDHHPALDSLFHAATSGKEYDVKKVKMMSSHKIMNFAYKFFPQSYPQRIYGYAEDYAVYACVKREEKRGKSCFPVHAGRLRIKNMHDCVKIGVFHIIHRVIHRKSWKKP